MGVQRGNAVASYATRQRPRVAIIGSGFAGRRAHDVLRRNGVEVHILDERGMMEFSPGVLRAMVEPEHTKRVLLRHPQQVEGKRAHSPRDGAVEVEGEGEREVDCTIVATGKPYARPIRPAREAGTHAVKERAGEIESEAEAIAGSGTIAVIGGGTVGVELAAEIAGKFRGTKGVYLVSSRPQILPRAPARAAEFAAQWLTKRNVTIVPNARALETEDGRLLVNGRDMTCDRTYWCTGSGESGTWRCDIFLCAQGRNQTFVAGDCGSWEGEKNALNGHLTGQLAAKNCLRLLRGQSLVLLPLFSSFPSLLSSVCFHKLAPWDSPSSGQVAGGGGGG